MKAAVYVATRNMYADIPPAVKALITYSDVEKIYLLLEDDDPGVWLPEICEVINVSGQKYFRKGSPNWTSDWSWIILLRAAFHRIFPDLDRILSLDLDAFPLKDISGLWDLDLSGKYFAAAAETTPLSRPGIPYYNVGVMMLNLELLRSSGAGDEVIRTLRNRRWTYPEQDAYNAVCGWSVLPLPPEYNAGRGTMPWNEPVIRHFMGEQATFRQEPVPRYFRELDWEIVLRCMRKRSGS